MKKSIILFICLSTLVSCNLFKSSVELELIPYLEKDKYGYFDLDGKIVISPQFSEASAFREGLALVKLSNDNGEEGKWGYIDNNGKIVINATYKSATVFQNGLAWVVSENSAPSAIDKSGEIKFTLKDAQEVQLFSEDLAAFSIVDTTSSSGVKWGFVDNSGNQVINPQFNRVGKFKEGKCAVSNKEGKWGYIDKTGKIVINNQFDKAGLFTDGNAVVSMNNKAGVIDTDGKYVINPQYSDALNDGEIFIVSQEGKIGWCDKEGKFVINPQFEDGSPFKGNKLACVKSAGKYGYIDKDSKIVINPQFDKASPFVGKVAIVNSGGKYGLIDEEGKYKVNPQFDNISRDVFYFLEDESEYNSVTTDYLDVNSILNIINIDKLPEGINFNDNYNAIITKLNISPDNFYGTEQIVISNKKISNDASYSFVTYGNMKMMDPNTYEYVVSNEKPFGFGYFIDLKGNAYGKAESVIKAFESKLSGCKLIKKGYLNDSYSCVYKNSSGQNIVLIGRNSTSVIFIYSKDHDISNFINQITDSKDDAPIEEETVESPVSVDDEYSEAAADTTAAYAAPAYDGYE
jgi:hypothetical protein